MSDASSSAPDPLEGRPRYVFGSRDSVDRDVLYAVDALPEREVARRWCQHPHENRNLIVIEGGVIRDCFKGHPDETNNALLATYALHPQTHPLPITRALPRLVPLKAVRAVRMILSHLSRSARRAEIKGALRSLDQARRVETLAALELSALTATVDAWKSIAFQLGQLLALCDGRELYTKADIAAFAPGLAPLLSRQPTGREVLRALDELKRRLLDALAVAYTRCDDGLNVFCYRTSTPRAWSRYAAQCRGIVVDLRSERCLVRPYEKFFRLDEVPGWRRADLAGRTPDEIVEKIDGALVSLFRHRGALRFVSKGSFDSDAVQAARRLAPRYPLERLELERATHVFEVVYADSRFPRGFTSVRHDQEGLHLIGIRERVTGALAPYAEVAAVARAHGLGYPRRFAGSFEEAIAACEARTWQNAEGWVANFQGQRVKLKHRAYLRTSDVINALKRGSDRVLRAYLRMPKAEREVYGDFFPPDLAPHLERALAPYWRARAGLSASARRYAQATFDGSLAALAGRVRDELAPAYHKLVLRTCRGQPVDELLHDAAAWTLRTEPWRGEHGWTLQRDAPGSQPERP